MRKKNKEHNKEHQNEHNKELGASILEYAILLTGISLFALLTITTVGKTVSCKFDAIENCAVSYVGDPPPNSSPDASLSIVTALDPKKLDHYLEHQSLNTLDPSDPVPAIQ